MATKKLPVSVTTHKDHNGNLTEIARTIGKETITYPVHSISVNDVKPAPNYKHWSDEHLLGNIGMQDKILDEQSSKINNIDKKITQAQKDQDEIDQKLKQMGYDKYVDAVNAQNSLIDKLQKQYAKANAKDRKGIKDKIEAAQKVLKDLKNKYSNVNAKAKELINKKGKLSDKIRDLKKSKKAVQKKHDAHKKKKAAYQKQLKKNKEKERAAKVKKAQKSIKNKIKKRSSMFGYPHSAMYEYDSTSDKVVFFFDTQVDESRTASATQNPVDKGNPIMDHVQLSSMSVSFTSKMMAKTMHGLNQQYKTFYEWQKNKVLSFEGEVYWAHAVLTDISKSYSTPATTTNVVDYNGHWFTLNVSFTLTYVMLVKVEMTKAKPKKKVPNKGDKGPSKNTSKPTIAVKYGMTYWDLARKYHTTVAQLRKWNGSEYKTLMPDKTGKYPKRLRVK
ncbi:phage baseplate protein [Lentilactobacillus senioris]|uniref:LysM peptidoglycan-binding domain-containing protein n=1 Tax=Lentilactobacillus senioris TaxID=931534 RepID=UPI003D2DCEF7